MSPTRLASVHPEAEPLAPREAYRRWAPTYEEESAVSFLEDHIVRRLSPPLDDRRLLDAACGTGRRLRSATRAAFACGIDLTPEMLQAGRRGGLACHVAAADLRRLPFRDGAFDIIWCRLAIGHLPAIDVAYQELARVCRAGGTVVVTDFHPSAARAGHRRTFRDGDGALWMVEHHVHDPDTHVAAAAAAGLRLHTQRDGRVGPPLRPFYARAGRLERYDRDLGLELVLALAFVRLSLP